MLASSVATNIFLDHPFNAQHFHFASTAVSYSYIANWYFAGIDVFLLMSRYMGSNNLFLSYQLATELSIKLSCRLEIIHVAMILFKVFNVMERFKILLFDPYRFSLLFATTKDLKNLGNIRKISKTSQNYFLMLSPPPEKKILSVLAKIS